jgi:hypothetical protein
MNLRVFIAMHFVKGAFREERRKSILEEYSPR